MVAASTLISIATNLKSSVQNKEPFSLEEAREVLVRRTNNYEVVPPVHRFYFDVDGKNLDGLTESEFRARDAETLQILRREMADYGADARFLTASSWPHRIISYRIYLQDRHGTTAANKQVAEHFKKTWKLPEGISVDTVPYGRTNQKLRMLGSHKDGENRPLRKVDDDEPDCFFVTLISEGSHEVKERVEKPASNKRGRPKKAQPATLVGEILAALADARADCYDDWLRIGMACKAEAEPIETWIEFSRRSPKFEEGTCEAKWETFKRADISIGTLWAMLEEDDPARAEQLKQGDYEAVKKEFETTHFKIRNPVAYCALEDGQIVVRSRENFVQLFENKLLRDGKPFLNRWFRDPAVRTFNKLTYVPAAPAELPNGDYNIFTGWGITPAAGDISAYREVLALHANGRPEVGEYLDKLLAHRIQKPAQKPHVAIWAYSDGHGTGKDTFFNMVARVLGKYFFSANEAANSLLGRFTSHLERAIVVRIEEPHFEHIANGFQQLKSMVTSDEMIFEEKGKPRYTLPNYTLYCFTTNFAVPFPIESDDRRNFLYEVSAERKGDQPFWARIHAAMETPEFAAALLHHWQTLDITGFNPVVRPRAPLMEAAKQQCAPLCARFLHNQIQMRYEDEEHIADTDEMRVTAQDLTLFARREFPAFKVEKAGRMLSEYAKKGALTASRNALNRAYVFSPKKMLEHLRKAGWVEAQD